MKKTIEEQIKKLLRYNIEADLRFINIAAAENGDKLSDELLNKKKKLQLFREAITALYSTLNENERFVIQRHFVQQIDWDCLSEEFVQKWGEKNLRSKRSFMNLQSSGFKKMAMYIERNFGVFDYSWLFDL